MFKRKRTVLINYRLPSLSCKGYFFIKNKKYLELIKPIRNEN